METAADVDETSTPLGPPPVIEEPDGPPPPARKLQAKKLAPVAAVAAPTPARTPSVQRQLKNEDEVALKEWLDGIAADGQLKVAISRKNPRVGPRGENIAGSLETVEGVVDDDYIRETWGGGEFTLKVMTPQGPNGSYRYFTGRTLKIAGDPKMHGRNLGDGGASPAPIVGGDDPLAARAFDTMERISQKDRDRADQLEREARLGSQRPAIDYDAIQRINQPTHELLLQAQKQIADLQSQMLVMSQKPAPRDEFRDGLMQRAIEGEGRKLEEMRMMYEARLDKMRDNHDDHIKRLEDRHHDDVKRMEDRHGRELASVKGAVEQGGRGLEQAMQARIDAKSETITRLERELTGMQTKLSALEAIKNQSLTDKADEIIKVKEALSALGGDDGDGEEKWYEKLIGAVGNSEAALAVINKLSGGPPAPGGQQQMQLPPPGVPFQTGDGNIYVRDAAGNTKIVNQQQLRARNNIAAARARKKQQAAPAQDPVEAGLADEGDEGEEGDEDGDEGDGAPVGRPPDAKEMKMAISFMENALARNAPPEEFARSAMSLVPTDVLDYMRSVGIERFLANAGLPSGSPLTTVRGKNFVRAVARILGGGEA